MYKIALFRFACSPFLRINCQTIVPYQSLKRHDGLLKRFTSLDIFIYFSTTFLKSAILLQVPKMAPGEHWTCPERPRLLWDPSIASK